MLILGLWVAYAFLQRRWVVLRMDGDSKVHLQGMVFCLFGVRVLLTTYTFAYVLISNYKGNMSIIYVFQRQSRRNRFHRQPT